MRTKIYDNDDFSKRLDDAIYNKHMTNTEVAKMIGRERKCVMNWRNNVSSPCVVDLRKLCAILDVSPDYLVWGRKNG